jgi:succinate dehydrogenase / fumarate reductase membrane anchor subunit
MAVRAPRTLRDARATYTTNGELAWWVFMRVSGLALIFLTFGHLYMSNIVIDAGQIDFNYVARRLSITWVKIYDTLLLGLAVLHGVNGARYSIEDYARHPGWRFGIKMGLYSATVLVMIIGIISLWAVDYTQYLNLPPDATPGAASGAVAPGH